MKKKMMIMEELKMKTKKKNRFLTFCFSCLPGAAEMYMGFMKMGLSLMLVFFAIIIIGKAWAVLRHGSPGFFTVSVLRNAPGAQQTKSRTPDGAYGSFVMGVQKRTTC